MTDDKKRVFKPSTRICIVDGCNNQVGRHGAKDMCCHHYRLFKNENTVLEATGVCDCGCGSATYNGNKFKHGHWAKKNRLVLSLIRYKNAKTNHGDGYISVQAAPLTKRKLEHVVVAEKALGKQLPKGSQVHHINQDRSDNRPQNLVICQDAAYHMLLHVRTEAFEATGNANMRKCLFCQQWDQVENLYISPSGTKVEHRSCGNKYRKEFYKEQRRKQNELNSAIA